MTVEELHQDEDARRREFPVCGQSVFLAHAGVCPVPRRVAAAMAHYASECMSGDQEAVFPEGRMLETRKLAAQLLGRAPQEIALIGPTSVALSLVAGGLDWRPSDNVVFYHDDYPSNALPWMALAEKGVELREVKPRSLGEIGLQDVAPLTDDRTRLVALASAHFVSGHRLDVDEIGQWARSRGILFCLDGIQTLGAIQASAAHVDFLAADSHKWLLGPCAAGILFVRRETQERLRPILLGGNNVLCPGYITPERLDFPRHAGRYEAGSPNLIGIAGLHAALSMLTELGMADIEAAVLNHTRFLRTGLTGRGYILAGASGTALSGITSFRHAVADMSALHRKLGAEGIITSLRQTRDGRRWIRLSPHFYNTRQELERLLNLL